MRHMAARTISLTLTLVSAAAALRVGGPARPGTSPAKASLQPSAPLALASAAGLAALSVVEPAYAGDVSWVAPTKFVLAPVLTIGTVLFLMRVVLSWFPKYDLKELPWSIAALPTEPILKPTRLLIPPVAGVDISPLVWVGFLSFINEILLGPQGLLTIIERKG